MAVVSARRERLPSITTAAAAGVSSGGGAGMQDRRVVEVDGVAAEAEPAPAGPTDEQRGATSGATTSPRAASIWRAICSDWACSGVAAASTLSIAASRAPSKSQPRRYGSMSSSKIDWRSCCVR